MAGNPSAREAEQSQAEYERNVNDAIRNTEFEIFDEALGNEELDRDGDTTLEDMGEGLEGEELDEEDEDGEESPEREQQPREDERVDARASEQESEEGEGEETNEQPRGDNGQFQRREDAPRENDARIPPGVLRESNERARRAEASRFQYETENSQLRSDLAQMQEQLRMLTTGLQTGFRANPQQQAPAQQQPQAKPEPPDMFADPEGFRRHMQEQAEQLATTRAQEAVRAYHEQQVRQQEQQFRQAVDQNIHAYVTGPRGYEFNAAYNTLTSLGSRDPQARALAQAILRSPDPGRSILEWWEQTGMGEEFRASPQYRAHRDSIQQAYGFAPARQAPSRQQSNSETSQPRHEFRGPQRLPSLNEARGSNPQRVADPDLMDNSESSVFSFATRR